MSKIYIFEKDIPMLLRLTKLLDIFELADRIVSGLPFVSQQKQDIPLPESMLTEQGYPTEELLTFISHFYPTGDWDILWFINEVLKKVWWVADDAVELEEEEGTLYLRLHTFGWSGNEDIIRSIAENHYFKLFLPLVSYHTGGHYTFKVNSHLLIGGKDETSRKRGKSASKNNRRNSSGNSKSSVRNSKRRLS